VLGRSAGGCAAESRRSHRSDTVSFRSADQAADSLVRAHRSQRGLAAWTTLKVEGELEEPHRTPSLAYPAIGSSSSPIQSLFDHLVRARRGMNSGGSDSRTPAPSQVDADPFRTSLSGSRMACPAASVPLRLVAVGRPSSSNVGCCPEPTLAASVAGGQLHFGSRRSTQQSIECPLSRVANWRCRP